MSPFQHLKLYHYPATRSARVKWMLHEVLDDDFEVEIVPLYDGAQYEPEYLEKNPNHNVPALELTLGSGEQLRMLESGAIIAMLADAFPDAQLAPPVAPPSPARIDYLQMLHFGSTWADMMLWQVRIHEHVLPEVQRDARTAARYRNKFTTEVEPQLKTRLQRTTFVCGDAFTAADCVIAHDVLWARLYGMCADPVFERYITELAQRPAFAKAFADVHQFSAEVPQDKPIIQRFTG